MREILEKIKWWFTVPEEEEKVYKPFKEKLPSKIKMRRKINTLETENEVLKNTIKDELYKEFMKKLGEPDENKRLREENKKFGDKKTADDKELKKIERDKWENE